MFLSSPARSNRLPAQFKWLLLLSMSILSSACTVFGVESVEEAPYELIKKDEQFEIRQYESYVIAETLIDADFKEAGNKAFKRLFGYISGENQANEKISMTAPVIAEKNLEVKDTSQEIDMTAPVIAEKDEQGWRYAFVLPKSFSMGNAPKPTSPDVILREIPAKRVATIRYAGRATDKAKDKYAKELNQWIESQSLTAASKMRWAGYNAPWTLPPFRRNEVLIDILEK